MRLTPDRTWLLLLPTAMLGLSCCSGNRDGADLTFSGSLEATKVTIRAVSPGLVSWIAPEGSQLSAGDVVATIDSTDAVLAREARRAQASLADAQLRLLERGSREEDQAAAAQALTAARASLRNAEEDLRRMDSLAEAGSVTGKERDDAGTRYTIALASTRQAEEALKKLRIGPLAEELDGARARLRAALADLAISEKAVADCRLLAPLGALVSEKLVERGDLVQRYGAVAVLSQLDPIRMTIYCAEDKLGRVRTGGAAKITIDTFPDRQFSGRVVYIADEAEFTPKNVQTRDERVRLVFEVHLEIPNPDGSLKPGLPADANLE